MYVEKETTITRLRDELATDIKGTNLNGLKDGETIMKNSNGINEDDERKKIKLVLCIVMICFFQSIMLVSIVLGLCIGKLSEPPLTVAPLIVATLGLAIYLLIGFKKNRY